MPACGIFSRHEHIPSSSPVILFWFALGLKWGGGKKVTFPLCFVTYQKIYSYLTHFLITKIYSNYNIHLPEYVYGVFWGQQ